MPTATFDAPSRSKTIVALGLCLLASLALPAPAGPLDRELARRIEGTNLGAGARVAVRIVDLDTGDELGSYNSDEPMIPASNMKLLTSGAALFVLGGDFTFRTELILDETTTPPTLIVRGDGDPALGDPAIFIGEQPGVTLGTLFDQIAAALRQAGIEQLSRVVIDDRVFDRTYTHPCWPIDQLNRWYCAQVGGLNFYTNVINVYTRPSSNGAPIISLEPDAHWVSMRVKAKSDASKRDTAWIARPIPENSFTLYGNVGSKGEIPVSIDSPPDFAGRLLVEELSDRGIAIGETSDSGTDDFSLIGPNDTIHPTRTVAVITTPLFDVLERTNTDSHNLYAEALLKRIGHEVTGDPGSWENGATVLRMMLTEKIGPAAAESTVISDGSGMCRQNKVSADTLSQWMRSIARSDYWDMFRDSLATPGNGTLRRRFTNGELESELYAKSGYLTGTYALSGILEHPVSRQRMAFSIMLNDVKVGATSRRAKPLIDAIVEQIDQHMARRAGSENFGG